MSEMSANVFTVMKKRNIKQAMLDNFFTKQQQKKWDPLPWPLQFSISVNDYCHSPSFSVILGEVSIVAATT